ncbi:MAG: branched-chain amino acid ABC transporter permease [Erysipelotrichaceae bacterium]|nr:branched-chain amino acid ABC transporter permease [Erysipelotrichaceae bacterium]MBQ4251848.1 branched-chain amino acid ABC transporter permease [Erysipelotrichaceae bacterium]
MLLQVIVNGFSLGSIYALTAIGYSLIYSILQLINMSNAAVFLTSAIIFYGLYISVTGSSILLTFILTLLAAGALGYLIEVVAIRPIRNKGDSNTYALISSIGVKTMLEQICQGALGSEIQPFPTLLGGKYINIGTARIGAIQILIVAVTLSILFFMNWYTQHTRIGRGLRALSQNLNACHLMGMPVNTLIGVSFAVGSMLAAVSGVAYCMYLSSVQINISAAVGNKAFAATVIGGIGELKGAVIGGYLLAIVENFVSMGWQMKYANFVSFIAIILVLIIKPTGLFGKKEQKKV